MACVTGSRDSQLALWRVRDEDDCNADSLADSRCCFSRSRISSRVNSRVGSDERSLSSHTYRHIKPLSMKSCQNAEKVRAFAYNDLRQVGLCVRVICVKHIKLYLISSHWLFRGTVVIKIFNVAAQELFCFAVVNFACNGCYGCNQCQSTYSVFTVLITYFSCYEITFTFAAL